MHPTIKILALIFLGLALNKLALGVLIAMLCLMVFVAVHLQVRPWLHMIWRMRWLFLSMLLVYGLTTPGEYIKWMPIDWGVTYEGVGAGILQILRLTTMLGGIAFLMATTMRNDLIAGFYLLLTPLRVFKLQPERFAARLCLTLQYLEDAELQHQKNKGKNFWTQLLDMRLSEDVFTLGNCHETRLIELQTPIFSYIDFIGSTVMLAAALIIWI